jgi:uncharacterized protein YhfF
VTATALVLDVVHRGREIVVDVPVGTRPLAALGRDSWPLGGRDDTFLFVEEAPQPDRTWTRDDALWSLYVEIGLGGWEPPSRDFDVFFFGSTPEQAARLAHHVIKGHKRATTGWVAACEHDGVPIPTPGLVSIITDGFGIPLCAIQSERVQHMRFGDATDEIARGEDEGDRTLADWRDSHIKYFTTEAARIGRTFDDDSIIFSEYFRLLRVFQR